MSLALSVSSFGDAYLERAREAAASAVVTSVALGRTPAPGSLAGWWCDPATDDVLVLPNPWDDADAIALFDRWTWEVHLDLVRALGQRLNALHGSDESNTHWELVLGPWMLIQLAVVVDRLLFLRAARAIAPGAPVAGGGPLRPHATLEEAVGAQRTDAFNAALMTAVAERIGMTVVPGSSASATAHRPPKLTVAAALRLARRMARAVPWWALSRRRGRRIALLGVHRLSGSQLLRLARDVPGLRVAPSPLSWPAGQPPGTPGAEHPGRRSLARNTGGEGPEDILEALLDRLTPRSVVEGYGELLAAARRRYGPPAHIVHGSYGYDDAENVFVARSAAAGKRLAFAQHGGCAMQLEVAAAERFEQRPGTVRFTWGSAQEAQVVSVPSPYVQELHDTHRGGEHVVLVEHIVPPDTWLMRFSTVPTGNQAYAELERTVAFVRELPPRVRASVALKRFPIAGDVGARHPLMAGLAVPDAFAHRPLTEWMQRARLAVVPYPDTPFMEAMVIGVPVIGLWDAALWRARPDAAPAFERLEALGVVHRDPAAAAAAVEAVWEDPSAWWARPELQQARAAWLQRFAVIGAWREPWVGALRDLARD